MDADTQHSIIFLPFLRIRKAYAVGGVEFLPLRDENNNNVPATLESAVAPLTTILGGYVDRNGHDRVRGSIALSHTV